MSFHTICSFSQDIITKKSGEDIKANISEVGINEIKYKKFENQEGPTYSILKQDILIVRYSNGSKDIFNEPSITSSLNNDDLFLQGQKDALKYYKGYKGSVDATLLTSVLLSPIIGLVPAISSTSSEIEDSKLNYPNVDLIKKTSYYNGYTQKATKIRNKKVWGNWCIALGVDIIAIIFITH